jgi:hypothetical protein
VNLFIFDGAVGLREVLGSLRSPRKMRGFFAALRMTTKTNNGKYNGDYNGNYNGNYSNGNSNRNGNGTCNSTAIGTVTTIIHRTGAESSWCGNNASLVSSELG